MNNTVCLGTSFPFVGKESIVKIRSSKVVSDAKIDEGH